MNMMYSEYKHVYVYMINWHMWLICASLYAGRKCDESFKFVSLCMNQKLQNSFEKHLINISHTFISWVWCILLWYKAEQEYDQLHKAPKNMKRSISLQRYEIRGDL